MFWYPHDIKLLHHTEKCAISNKAINMHSLGPTEQYFCILEPHCGYLHEVKKVCWYPLIKEGQRSYKNRKCAGTPIYYTTPVIIHSQWIWSPLTRNLTEIRLRGFLYEGLIYRKSQSEVSKKWFLFRRFLLYQLLKQKRYLLSTML